MRPGAESRRPIGQLESAMMTPQTQPDRCAGSCTRYDKANANKNQAGSNPAPSRHVFAKETSRHERSRNQVEAADRIRGADIKKQQGFSVDCCLEHHNHTAE